MNPNEKLFKGVAATLDRIQFQQNILADNLVRLNARLEELEKQEKENNGNQ